jgi:hypothetical protein
LLLLLLVGRQGQWFWLLGWMLLGQYWFDSIFIASNLIANNININTNKTTTIVGSNLQANANNAVNSDNAVNSNNANNAVNTDNTNNGQRVLTLCLFCTLDTSRFLVLRLSWLVACRLAPLILVSWVVLGLMLVAVRLVFNLNHNPGNNPNHC